MDGMKETINSIKDKKTKVLDPALQDSVDSIDLLLGADQYCKIITYLTNVHGTNFPKD